MAKTTLTALHIFGLRTPAPVSFLFLSLNSVLTNPISVKLRVTLGHFMLEAWLPHRVGALPAPLVNKRLIRSLSQPRAHCRGAEQPARPSSSAQTFTSREAPVSTAVTGPRAGASA